MFPRIKFSNPNTDVVTIVCLLAHSVHLDLDEGHYLIILVFANSSVGHLSHR